LKTNKVIGLYFGSFNPIHNGHLMIANYMAEFGDLDQVWFVISPQNPFKMDQNLLPDYHRRELLTRAIGDYPRFRICSAEFQLPKPSYTFDTLVYLEEKYPTYRFKLIVGSDQLSGLHLWKKSDELLSGYSILVYPRLDVNNQFPNHELLEYPHITLVEAPVMEISSSFIRQSIKQKKDVQFYMPQLAWQYLTEMHFYE